MSSYRQIKKTITLAATTGTANVWDNPYSCPVKNLTIYVRGLKADAANITKEIFFGGVFKIAGTQVAPYTEGSTHSGGVSLAAASALDSSATTEVAHVAYSNSGVLPANIPNSDMGLTGMPIVVKLTNGNAYPVTLDVIFVAETLSSTV